MRAWKQVDEEHASCLEAGSLRIGTLDDYGSLENGRADPLDGAVQTDFGMLLEYNPQDQDYLRHVGEKTGLYMSGSVFGGSLIRQVRRIYSFCMSEVGCDYDPSPEIPKAVFEVLGVTTLSNILATKNSERLARATYGRVTYDARILTPPEHLVEPDPFSKRPEFSHEREIRIVFPAVSGSPFETLYTTADPEVASLFRRIS